jgi:predicted transcriptional regulator
MSTGKGKKRLRNVPALYDEMKSVHRLMLTPTAWKKLQEIAVQQNTSISELIEVWARNYDGS